LRKRFSNDPTPFLNFCDYLPFEEDLALNLNKFDQLVPEMKIFENFQCIFTLCYFLPLENGIHLHWNNLESPSPKDDLCQVCMVKLAQWLVEEVKNVKDYRQMDRQMYGQRTTGDQNSSLELSA
jgi:hypothetical protein